MVGGKVQLVLKGTSVVCCWFTWLVPSTVPNSRCIFILRPQLTFSEGLEDPKGSPLPNALCNRDGNFSDGHKVVMVPKGRLVRLLGYNVPYVHGIGL